MSAIEWVRSHATINSALADTLECEGQIFRSEGKTFRGRVPFRMITELSRSELIKSDSEFETLRVDRKSGAVDYAHITYIPA